MAVDPIIFADGESRPEIKTGAAHEARKDVIMANRPLRLCQSGQ
jgi:hypothetical protein